MLIAENASLDEFKPTVIGNVSFFHTPRLPALKCPVSGNSYASIEARINAPHLIDYNQFEVYQRYNLFLPSTIVQSRKNHQLKVQLV